MTTYINEIYMYEKENSVKPVQYLYNYSYCKGNHSLTKLPLLFILWNLDNTSTSTHTIKSKQHVYYHPDYQKLHHCTSEIGGYPCYLHTQMQKQSYNMHTHTHMYVAWAIDFVERARSTHHLNWREVVEEGEPGMMFWRLISKHWTIQRWWARTEVCGALQYLRRLTHCNRIEILNPKYYVKSTGADAT